MKREITPKNIKQFIAHLATVKNTSEEDVIFELWNSHVTLCDLHTQLYNCICDDDGNFCTDPYEVFCFWSKLKKTRK